METPTINSDNEGYSGRDGRNNSRRSTLLAILLAATITAVGGCIGAALLLYSEPEPTPAPPKPVAEREDPIEAEPHFDYGEWPDLNDLFDYNNVGMLARDRFSFRTSELCVNTHRWRSTSISTTETTARVFATPGLAIRSEHPSNSKSLVVNNLQYGSKLKILEMYDGNIARVEYVEGPTRNAVKGRLTGYVSTEFLASEAMFDIMERYVLPTDEAKQAFNVSKWRMAATDIVYALGATHNGPRINIAIENHIVVERGKESVVVFGLTRDDSATKLLAIVEFFATDNEYRILGIIPGESIANSDIKFYNTGDYYIIYSTAKQE